MSFTQELLRCEGIVLRSLPYRENDKILTLMTKEQGLLQAIVYKKNLPASYTQPSSKVELLYKQGKGSLVFVWDLHLIDAHEQIRNSLEALLEVSKLLNITLKTQVDGQSAGEIYALLQFFIPLSAQMKDPALLSLLYAIKIFIFEGVIGFQMHCRDCGCASIYSFFGGEWLCNKHSNERAIAVSEDVRVSWLELSCVRSLNKIREMIIRGETKNQIQRLIDHMLSQ